MTETMRALPALVRPTHWIKNGFVVAPAIFAGVVDEPIVLQRTLFATLAFCAAASSVYVFNDLMDARVDRRHPIKATTRPIAAGRVGPGSAWKVLAVLLAITAVCLLGAPAAWSPIAGYMLLNAAYSTGLKAVAVVDLLCIASGFVLRLAAGAFAASVPLTGWMMVTTFSLALYLAATKRRQELGAGSAATRPVLARYSPGLLNACAFAAAATAIVCYCLFVVLVRPRLGPTVPLVLFGMLRYAQLIRSQRSVESPVDVIWGDRLLLATVAAWVGYCAWALV